MPSLTGTTAGSARVSRRGYSAPLLEQSRQRWGRPTTRCSWPGWRAKTYACLARQDARQWVGRCTRRRAAPMRRPGLSIGDVATAQFS